MYMEPATATQVSLDVHGSLAAHALSLALRGKSLRVPSPGRMEAQPHGGRCLLFGKRQPFHQRQALVPRPRRRLCCRPLLLSSFAHPTQVDPAQNC